ncbi:unnamed protein product [Orchesella dallaii]|uniref:Uncharacterized protein n=1 Tax=Orchesella dallaii TaxID=48710 RepID=A0ABP1QP36_9HEXA
MEDDDYGSFMGTCWGWTKPFASYIGSILFLIAFALIFVAYVSPNWLAVIPSKAPSDNTFLNMGLWLTCYTNVKNPYYDTAWTFGYQGCRWVYYPVLASFTSLQDYLLPSFIVAVQIGFSFCFLLTMILFFTIIVYLIKYSRGNREGKVPFLIVTGMLLHTAGILGILSVIVFGSLAGSRYWAYQWQFHKISWAFGLAVAGSVLLHIAGIFFLVEACCQFKSRQRMLEASRQPSPSSATTMTAGDAGQETMLDSASRLVLTPINKLSSMLKDRFGVSERHDEFKLAQVDELDKDGIPQRPEQLEGSPYGRRKPLASRIESDAVQQQSAPAVHRPPSPPVPPPPELDEGFNESPPRPATRAEVSKQALSTILNSVAAKQSHQYPHRDTGEGEPRYSFSSASSTDEMLPAATHQQPPSKDRQLMTSALFDRFSAKPTPAPTGKGRQAEKLYKTPEKSVPVTSSSAYTPPPPQPLANHPSTSTYGLPSSPSPLPYGYYHQPVALKRSSPETPSHPFSPADTPTKPNLSSLFHGQMTPSTASSQGDSPPAFKAMAKGELRSIEISSPVLVSSSNQSIRQMQTSQTSSTGQHQPLATASLQKVVYEYAVPSAPPVPATTQAQSTRGYEYEQGGSRRARPEPLSFHQDARAGARRAIEEIITHEIDKEMSDLTEELPGGGRSSQQGANGKGNNKPSMSTAAAVAEILANRQPLSVRISIEKHKKETSYKKSQSYGPDGRGHKKDGGGGGKKGNTPFSESSL